MRLPIKPYIGITDFTTWAQVQEMVRVFQTHKQPMSLRQLGVGAMMSRKTLRDIETPWSKAFPKKELIGSILTGVGIGTFNCLHYADYQSRQGFADDLTEAIYWGGPFINAVQLDMTWPDPHEVQKAVQESGRDIEIILQIGRKAFELAGDNQKTVLGFLNGYKDVIHRVLLDRSVGRGIPMKPEVLLPYARLIKQQFPELGLVVAGGLGPKSVDLARPIVAEFPDVSIDAQSQLRPSGNALDPVDWDMAGEYLVEGMKFLK